MSADTTQPQDAPTHWGGILKHLGPGLIITACIVGSGELIATPVVGAKNGFTLLWFIILGCIVKVFVQVELGRAAMIQGKTTLELMDSVPGPRFIVSWLIWCFVLMFISIFFQLGGIVGGVGQVFAQGGVSFDDRPLGVLVAAVVIINWACVRFGVFTRASTPWLVAGAVLFAYLFAPAEWFTSAKSVALIVASLTVAILASGQYKHVERFSVVMVVFFVFSTMYALYALQTASGDAANYAITGAQIMEGLKFNLPSDLSVAFGAFGMIGVGASELIYYPYWCLEKGYSRYVGPRARAKGWLRIMRVDSWVSMVIYTSATIVFYLLGAALLHGRGKDVSNETMIGDLSEMFTSIGPAGLTIFLVGAFVVLFSTLTSASASNARLLADTLVLLKLRASPKDETARRHFVSQCCVFIPCACAVLFLFLGEPVTMVFIGGVAQAFMLVPLSGAALYFRYCKTEKELQPGMLWTTLLWLSALAMAAVGLYMAQSKVRKQFESKTPIGKNYALDAEPFGKQALYCQSPNLRWERPGLGRAKNLSMGA